VAVALSACGTTNWGFPYRPDVQQGNWITSEQVAQLQPGMTREQVRFILGTPTLQDVFRTNRWDYPYYNKPGYGKEQERKFTVWFEGDTLVRWEGDEQPDRQPFQRADTGMTPAASKANTEAAAGSQPATAELDPSAAAQPSPVEASPVDAGAPASAAGEPAATPASQPEAETAPPLHRPILNTNPPRQATPGVPTPGRSTGEPLR
jgi:outer membrane protein assembly factor BamE